MSDIPIRVTPNLADKEFEYSHITAQTATDLSLVSAGS
jgi:hypothetical protein